MEINHLETIQFLAIPLVEVTDYIYSNYCNYAFWGVS